MNRKPTAQRIALIQGLLRIGGKLEANGKGYLGRSEIIAALGMPERGNPASFTALLAAAERDGQIKRDIHGKRTKAIYLVDPQGIEAPEGQMPVPVEPSAEVMPSPKRRTTRAMKPLPMPQVGETAEVFMVMRERDGTMHFGIRDDERSWMASVHGYTEE